MARHSEASCDWCGERRDVEDGSAQRDMRLVSVAQSTLPGGEVKVERTAQWELCEPCGCRLWKALTEVAERRTRGGMCRVAE